MNDAYASFARFHGAAHVDIVTVQKDTAGVLRIHSTQDLDQRRLAGAVLAQDHMDFSRTELKVDVIQGADAGKALDDVLHL